MSEYHSNKDKFLSLQGQTNPFPYLIEVDYARGSYIFDKSGKAYLDMIAGVAVNNIGHNHPHVIQALTKQINRHLHVMVYGEFIQDAQLDLAEKLCSVLPPSLNCVYTVNSGTEANEAALKLAKRATGRQEIISCKGSYHGSTHGSLSVSGNESKKAPFLPLLPEIKFIRHNEVADLETITEKTAGVIIEPVQGDAGVRMASDKYLKALRDKCTETGTMLIFDEIQCGMGRTGKMFAFEHSGVTPDILTLGKALGGGMPIGAFISSKEIMHLLSHDPILGHITTFGGHPVVCSAAAACIEVIKTEIDFSEVESKGKWLEDKISKHRMVTTVRRVGMMFAIDMENENIVAQVVKNCIKRGLISFWFLSHPYSFRLSPPLNISKEDLEKSADIILSAMDETLQ
ncbi:MAG: aspartate aminotransferase family protein [Brumimicrobium sp.]|nr:aspartate aminotransferase family protein [Brumimicrobium sp.]